MDRLMYRWGGINTEPDHLVAADDDAVDDDDAIDVDFLNVRVAL